MADSVLTPPRRQALVTDVADRLRGAILHGRFAPGERLREGQLATMLDVSRGPVREALAVLQREGLVLIKHHRGATVINLSIEDVEEVYSLRRALERLAIQWAIRKAQAKDVDSLDTAIRDMENANQAGMTVEDAAAFDVHFHTLLVQSAHHACLFESWLNLRSRIHMFLLYRTITNVEVQRQNVGHHVAILDALRGRDEATAIQVLDGHLERSYHRVLQRYDPHGVKEPFGSREPGRQ
jgi:DNA-binding GntR family transcriptional regulator